MTFVSSLRAGGAMLAALGCFVLCQPVPAHAEPQCARISTAKASVYKAPKTSSKVLDTLKEGTRLHLSGVVPATGQAAWYEFFEFDEGDGFVYAYLSYQLPGTNPFVRAQDVTILPDEACIRR